MDLKPFHDGKSCLTRICYDSSVEIFDVRVSKSVFIAFNCFFLYFLRRDVPFLEYTSSYGIRRWQIIGPILFQLRVTFDDVIEHSLFVPSLV